MSPFSRSTMTSILIFGYYGMGNAGSDIRLRQIVKDVYNANPEAHVTIAVFKYCPLPEIEDVQYITLHSAFLGTWELMFYLPFYDVIINGEGIPYVDFSGSGFLGFFLPILFLSNLFKKKTISYLFDIDNLSYLHNRLTKLVLQGTDLLVVRTKQSRNALKKIGITKKVFSGADASHLAPSRKLRKQKRVGFCFKDPYLYPVKVRPFGNKKYCFRYPLYYASSNKYKILRENFVSNMATAVDYFLVKHPKHRFSFIVMEKHMDEPITREIFKRVHHNNRIDIKAYPDVDIKSELSTLQCLVTLRYHAMVMAMDFAVPVYAIATDRRFESFLRELDVKKNICSHTKIKYKEIFSFFENPPDQKIKEKIKERKKLASKNWKLLRSLLA